MKIERIKLNNNNEINFNKYMLENKPIIIEDININEWLLTSYFINKNTLKYSPELFLNLCQNEIITIHNYNNCNNNNNNAIMMEMKINDFIN